MDTHPDRPDDVSDLERRLSGWAPASGGLDADAMLFAAGRAAASSRIPWPALAGCLAVLALALGAWALVERSTRLALAEQVRQRPAPSAPQQPAAIVPADSPAEEPAPNSVLAGHRALEHGLDAWPPRPLGPAGPHVPEESVLQVRQHDALLNP